MAESTLHPVIIGRASPLRNVCRAVTDRPFDVYCRMTIPPNHSNHSNHRCRIVVTGGPGGGKTTAADMFRREIGERIVIVPEAATMIFSGGFPRYDDLQSATSAVQRAIYHVQRNLEDVQGAKYHDRILLCDRGTIDGAAYWPGEPEEFYAEMGTSLEEEMSRYDGVIFFESAAVGGMGIEGGNPERCESLEEAVELDRKLRSIWSQHPCFQVVHHTPSFLKKISLGLAIMEDMVTELLER
jgi:predicted ATPase